MMLLFFCLFLLIDKFEHLFTNVSAICTCSLVNSMSISFARVSAGLLIFFIFICQGTLDLKKYFYIPILQKFFFLLFGSGLNVEYYQLPFLIY